MARIATRFHGPAQVSGAAVTKYTVAASQKAIIRNVHVYNPSAAAVTFTMSIGADAAATRIFDAMSIAPGQSFDHWCMYVLDATEIIQALAGTANVLVLIIDGELSVLS